MIQGDLVVSGVHHESARATAKAYATKKVGLGAHCSRRAGEVLCFLRREANPLVFGEAGNRCLSQF
jgi:hypothetical protein